MNILECLKKHLDHTGKSIKIINEYMESSEYLKADKSIKDSIFELSRQGVVLSDLLVETTDRFQTCTATLKQQEFVKTLFIKVTEFNSSVDGIFKKD